MRGRPGVGRESFVPGTFNEPGGLTNDKRMLFLALVLALAMPSFAACTASNFTLSGVLYKGNSGTLLTIPAVTGCKVTINSYHISVGGVDIDAGFVTFFDGFACSSAPILDAVGYAVNDSTAVFNSSSPFSATVGNALNICRNYSYKSSASVAAVFVAGEYQ